ncbi:MAG TPA: CBS domain-containing protein [Planctomycetota bacterium]|nr:CBS domain-containing protein [Planctomycetota bacterium]
MSAGRIAARTVQVVGPGETAREAARRMVTEGVGTLVVLGGDRRPKGFVTDRDLMFHCIAEGRDAARTSVETIMAAPVVSVPEDLPIEDALVRMAETRVRRLAVVDRAGCLAGLLALDDVLELLSEEFATVGRLLRGSG